MILTIDVGNSRVKLAQWLASAIIARKISNISDDDFTSSLDELFAGIEKPAKIFVVCVADETKRQLLIDWCARNWQMKAEFLKVAKQFKSIRHAYAEPEQHGADRWAAVVAGVEQLPASSLCVIGAGTAITFDLVDADARHLGGYILPSYVTMHKALLGDTAKVRSVADVQFIDQKKIPVNTNDALNEGLHLMLRAGVRDLCDRARRSLGDSMRIVITGGFAPTVLSYSELPEMIHSPDLVMHGLYTIMMNADT